MRQACDSLRQESVKKDMEILKSSLLNPSCNFGNRTSVPGSDCDTVISKHKYTDALRKPILKNSQGVSTELTIKYIIECFFIIFPFSVIYFIFL